MNKSTFVKKTTLFLNTLDFVKKPFVFDKLDSTNLTAKALAKAGAKEGTVVIARTQSHGRGRFDRIWQSPPGGIYLSLILRPTVPIQQASLLSFMTALAVTKTIRSYGVLATIKWPNDVRVNSRKIAGLLLESEGDGSKIDYVVVGIGINLCVDLKNLSSAIQEKSTSLRNELPCPVDYYDFLKIFFMTFEDYYSDFQAQKYDKILTEWKAWSDTLGKRVKIKTMTGTLQGTVDDVDNSGFLILRTEKGDTQKIITGDCLYFDELDHT